MIILSYVYIHPTEQNIPYFNERSSCYWCYIHHGCSIKWTHHCITISSILASQIGTDIFLKYGTEIFLLLLKSLIIYPIDIKEYLEICLYDFKYLTYLDS